MGQAQIVACGVFVLSWPRDYSAWSRVVASVFLPILGVPAPTCPWSIDRASWTSLAAIYEMV